MTSTPWAPEWEALLVKIIKHADSVGSTAEDIAEHLLDALFASPERFVQKGFNPKLLLSQFAQFAEASTDREETDEEWEARMRNRQPEGL